MNRRVIISIVAVIVVAAVVLRYSRLKPSTISSHSANTSATTNLNTSDGKNTNAEVTVPKNINAAPIPPVPVNTNIDATQSTTLVSAPIADFFTRITKKPFGIYITPKTSPIQPEKFTGYHTGADAETTGAEAKVDVPIMAVADGTIVFAGHVNGYGGVILIRHKIGTETVTVLYGHLRIASFTKKSGNTVKRGEKIAVLGTGYSSETDGERKHLHFGIIKGANINYKGYVQAKSELSAWEDPVQWLKAERGQ